MAPPSQDQTGQPVPEQPGERQSAVSRLNWLRAGVLGANDGIVSTAALVVGVAAATPDPVHILTAGFAGLSAGAMSMAVGEYVSVSTQRDAERDSLGVGEEELTSPWHAALASMVAFVAGAVIPLLAVAFAPVAWKVGVTWAAALTGLALTGYVSALLTGTPRLRPVVRNIVGGTLAMGVTFGIGALVGTQVG